MRDSSWLTILSGHICRRTERLRTSQLTPYAGNISSMRQGPSNGNRRIYNLPMNQPAFKFTAASIQILKVTWDVGILLSVVGHMFRCHTANSAKKWRSTTEELPVAMVESWPNIPNEHEQHEPKHQSLG